MAAIRADQTRIVKHSVKLEDHLRNSGGRPVDVSMWFSYFSFDVMGDLAFARSFNMLESGTWNHAVKLLRDGMSILGVVTPVPWLAQILFGIAGAASSWNSMIAWCKETMSTRLTLRAHSITFGLETSRVRFR